MSEKKYGNVTHFGKVFDLIRKEDKTLWIENSKTKTRTLIGKEVIDDENVAIDIAKAWLKSNPYEVD